MTDAPEKIWVDPTGADNLNMYVAYASDTMDFLNMDVEYTRTDISQARIAELEAALKWYAAHVADCRKLGQVGDVARGKLDRDGGAKAREALKAEP